MTFSRLVHTAESYPTARTASTIGPKTTEGRTDATKGTTQHGTGSASVHDSCNHSAPFLDAQTWISP